LLGLWQRRVKTERNRIFDRGIRSVALPRYPAELGRFMEKNRRSTLLRIGERLFTQHGYRDVSIRDITDAAGLGMGSFYTYFASKEEFYSAILDAIEQRGIREMEKHVNSLHSPVFRLKALFRYTTLSLRSNAILRGIYTGERRYLYPGLEDRMSSGSTLFARVEKLIEEILSEGTRRGMFRTSLFRNPKSMLIAIFTTLPLNVPGHYTEDLTDDVMMLIERGLKRWLRFRQRDERLDSRARRRARPEQR
jgi:AcrR family transcriptional regulator